MNKKTNINFPHPVLNNGEDYQENNEFAIVPDAPVFDGNIIAINIKYELKSPGVIKSIADGDLSAAIYLECIVTGFRKLLYFDNAAAECTIKVNSTDVSDELTIKGYLIANKKISEFKLDEHNSIFSSASIGLDKGGIAAITDVWKVSLDDYDPLKDKPSIFKITIGPDDQPYNVVVDESGERIGIRIKKELFDKYERFKTAPDVSAFLGALFVIPVLTETLRKMRDGQYEEDDKNRKWFKAIESQLQKHSIVLGNETSMIGVADKIITNVFNNSLDKIKKICGDMFNDETEVV
ncbi:MAG: hypothetical protein FWE53_04415 [Firmicutes bacterium]|nr:hypothetical protein [Bacillota bacterium]